MTERINIRRYFKAGVVVNVTQVDEGRQVHWCVRVLGPTPDLIRIAIRECRAQCAMLWSGVEGGGDE